MGELFKMQSCFVLYATIGWSIGFVILHRIKLCFVRSVVPCGTYFLKEYPNDFLEGRELLDSYENPPGQPYVAPSARPSTPKAKDDLGSFQVSKQGISRVT